MFRFEEMDTEREVYLKKVINALVEAMEEFVDVKTDRKIADRLNALLGVENES